jgi:hypothetical protein
MGEEERVVLVAQKLYRFSREKLVPYGLTYREFDALTNDEKAEWFANARFVIEAVEAHPPVYR